MTKAEKGLSENLGFQTASPFDQVLPAIDYDMSCDECAGNGSSVSAYV
jgi:hypothetical protein